MHRRFTPLAAGGVVTSICLLGATVGCMRDPEGVRLDTMVSNRMPSVLRDTDDFWAVQCHYTSLSNAVCGVDVEGDVEA